MVRLTMVSLMVAFLIAFRGIAIPPNPLPSLSGKVVEVIDGDTIKVNLDSGGLETVRLIGFDAPETIHPFIRKECFGDEAKTYFSNLVQARQVWLELDSDERDQYNRLLAYIYLEPEGLAMVNAILLSQAFGEVGEEWELGKNTRYLEYFSRLEREAKAAQRGYWQECFAESTVKITELYPNPPGDDRKPEVQAKERIKICNLGSVLQDLTDWSVTDKEGEFAFPSGTNLAGGECLELYGFQFNPSANPRALFLSNEAEEVRLRNATRKEVHRCIYKNAREDAIIRCPLSPDFP